MGRTFPIRTKCVRGSSTAELERREGCHGSQSRKVKSMSPVEKAVVHIVQELMNCTTEEVSQEAAREVYRWVCQQMPVRHAEAEFCCHNCRNKMLKLAQENLPNLLAQRRQRLEEEHRRDVAREAARAANLAGRRVLRSEPRRPVLLTEVSI